MQLARGSNWREQYIIRPGDGANVTSEDIGLLRAVRGQIILAMKTVR